MYRTESTCNRFHLEPQLRRIVFPQRHMHQNNMFCQLTGHTPGRVCQGIGKGGDQHMAFPVDPVPLAGYSIPQKPHGFTAVDGIAYMGNMEIFFSDMAAFLRQNTDPSGGLPFARSPTRQILRPENGPECLFVILFCRQSIEVVRMLMGKSQHIRRVCHQAFPDVGRGCQVGAMTGAESIQKDARSVKLQQHTCIGHAAYAHNL